jgi:excisionase family DNA binding protein
MATSRHLARRALLTERDGAELFSVSVRTVRSWARAGELTPVRIGGTTRYPAAQIEHLIAPVNDDAPAGQSERVETTSDAGAVREPRTDHSLTR